MLFIITITMAGLSIVVVHAPSANAQGTFAVFMKDDRHCTGSTKRYFGSAGGHCLSRCCSGHGLCCRRPALQGTISVTGDIAQDHGELDAADLRFLRHALPVWMLLTPRGYLSSFMKIGVFAALVVGVVFINPTIQFPGADRVHSMAVA